MRNDMSDHNPYSAPAADLEPTPGDADALFEPARMPAGRGWGWIAEGFEFFKQSPWVWIGMILIWFIISAALSMIPLVSVAVTVLSPVFLGGMMLGCRALEQNERLRVEHLFAGFNTRLGSLAAVGGLYLAGTVGIVLVALVPAMLVGGLGVLNMQSGADPTFTAGMGAGLLLVVLVAMLLFIPLIMAFWFAPVLIVRHEVPAFEAMRLSFVGCLRNIVPFLVYGLAVIGLSIIALIPLGLGFLILSPVLIGSIYAGYRDIFLGD
jgi:uncharacterized membrane protein